MWDRRKSSSTSGWVTLKPGPRLVARAEEADVDALRIDLLRHARNGNAVEIEGRLHERDLAEAGVHSARNPDLVQPCLVLCADQHEVGDVAEQLARIVRRDL